MDPSFEGSVAEVESLLIKAKKVYHGESLTEAGIYVGYMFTYGKIARQCRDDREIRLSSYHYEPGPSVGAFNGGYFEHPEWPIREVL